jgi:hypothetical protein
MSVQAQTNEGDKIESFRQLLSVITNNTKLEYEGKKAKTGVEGDLIKKNLALLLGRNPTAQELARAKQYA